MRHLFSVRRLARNDHGQAIVETALMLPILIFLILAGGDMARGYAIQIAIQNGARAGAEAAAIDYTPTKVESENRARDEMGRTPGMDAYDIGTVVDIKFHDGGGTDGTCVSPPTQAQPCFATVNVRMTWHTITAWPLIPNVFHFDRSTTVRMMNY